MSDEGELFSWPRFAGRKRVRSVVGLPALVVAGTVQSVGSVDALLGGIDGWWAYALVFVLAAIPWWEILLVIPPAVAIGLHPLPVAVAAFLGNLLPVYVIIATHGRVTDWMERRRAKKDGKSTRATRVNRLFTRYGVGGVALVAPLAIGVHLATVVLLLLDASPRSVGVWMTTSLGLWTVLLTTSAVFGVRLLGL